MAISTLATAGISLDAAGLYRKTVAAPDNVFIFTDGVNNWEIIDKKGPYVARLGGIIPSEGDVTSALQTILNNADVREVVFDEGNITINGTLNVPAGKKLTFRNDGRLIGTGTIVGGIINADFESNIFAQTLTITDSNTYPLAVGNRHFSVKWFGAVGDNSVDDQPAIQKTIDTLVNLTASKGKVKSVYLPIGKYRIDTPILLNKWDQGAGRYQFFSLDFIGETSFWEFDNSGTEILANFIDKFAIGVQLGKGIRIENIRVTGQFSYAWQGVGGDEQTKNFYASTYAGFTATLPCRDSRYSPYAGIVIDPFSTSVPADGGYPGLTSFYRGNTGAVGSTGIVIEECFVAGFVTGIITSPNGVTLNAELVDIFRVQFRDCKACVAGCQAQEKINRVSFMACWGACHTVFMFNEYGAQNPGYWSVDNVNLAGYNNRFIRREESGFFNMKIDAIYAEELGRIGDFDFTMGTTISNSIFDLRHPNVTKQYFLGVATGAGIFRSTTVRYYGFNGGIAPIGTSGNFLFDSCKLYQYPLSPNQTNARGERALGANIVTNGLGNFNNVVFGADFPQTIHPDDVYRFYADGKTVIQSQDTSSLSLVTTWSPKYSIPYAYVNEFLGNEIAVNPTGLDNSFTFAASPSELAWVKTGSIIAFFQNNRYFGYGVASVSGSNVTVSYIPTTVAPGNYKLQVYRELKFLTFLGDITAGSNLITNVRVDLGDLSRFTVDSGDNGRPIFAQNVVAPQTYSVRTTFLLTNWDAGTSTLTANKNFNVTKTGVYFSNNGYVKDISSYASNVNIFTTPGFGTTLLQKGGRVTVTQDGEPLTYVITKSGYLNAAAATDTRQAEWALDDCCATITTSTTTTSTP